MPGRTLTDGSKKRSQGASASWLLAVRIVLIAGLVVGGALLDSRGAQAHDGGEFGIHIPVERVAPGDDLPITGAEWAPGAVLEVGMQPSGSGLQRIGMIRTEADGHFDSAVRVPDGVASGPAVIHVTSGNGVLASSVVTIDPTAPRTGATASRSDRGNGLDPFLLIALGGAIAALLLLVFKTTRRKAVA